MTPRTFSPVLFVAVFSIAFVCRPIQGADVSATWLGATGNWTEAANWDTNPVYPNNGSGTTFDATINGGDVTLDQNITLQQLFYNGDKLEGSFDLLLNEGLTWTGGEIAGSSGSKIDLATGSVSMIAAPATGTETDATLSGRAINNGGSVTQSKVITGMDGVITNMAGASWNAGAGLGEITDPFTAFGPTFNNGGSYTAANNISVGGIFNNTGGVTIQPDASLFLIGGGNATGTFNVGAQGTLGFGKAFSPSNSYTLGTGAIITGAGTTSNITALIVDGNCRIETNFVNNGSLTVHSGATATFTGGFQGYNGIDAHGPLGITLEGGTITSSQTLFTGQETLQGFGVINGDVVAGSEGNIAPTGTLTINGFLSLGPATFTFIRIGGLTQGTDYDHLIVNGALDLDGLLFLAMANGFETQLDASQTFAILSSSSSLSGLFLNVANGDRLETSDGLASFQVNYGPDSSFGANEVVLSNPLLTAVPEPPARILLIAGIVLAGLMKIGRSSDSSRPCFAIARSRTEGSARRGSGV